MERKSSRSKNSGTLLSATESQRKVQSEEPVASAGDALPGRVSVAQMEGQGALTPDVRARELQGSHLFERIAATKITDSESYTLVCELGKEAKRIAKVIEEEFKLAIHQADL